ncbi:dihydroorotate dehydrogenase [candidate division WOR-1 bacterium RIFCSPLOWO2_02_FULL_46_20]|uniref:Dihydroorotate dehydrogenase n=2 Tax=Saganbacteria TaxID=1703751 RepID=A0A1F4RFQ6_UNCSA|nr:MAG: dihydroorotate dehydrogenase [candidate division WOR-1 bacterium RIFCSPHIGHO2_02_FULL_45_12]OGC07019.1 MAG: dihydroorotate dehydrogenase [candidate division WOR-1 bacterium RIFCSPLOWO2_02_FULL_46_20]OGC07981.1 MAG: dihydroorotate dehydrogenase [candidate division WOR-1 bacterium RIFCSPLOWO2_12_FULL_45_9]
MLNFVYITTKDKAEARKIGRVLVESRLAACVNIIDKMESIYWWQGKIEQGNEAVLIAKTKEMLMPKLIAKVKALHSYECPCIVALPVSNGNKQFLEWIENETQNSG